MFVAVVLVSLLPIVSSYFGLGYKNIARVTNFHPEAFSNHIDASAAVLASRIRNKNTVNSPTVSSDTKAFPFVTNEQSPEVALPTNNLPWKESINPSRKLTYMSMFNHQLEIVKAMGMKEVSLEEHIVYRSSSVKPARIGNMCFQNEQFRKVRMTYFDAGDAVQVTVTIPLQLNNSLITVMATVIVVVSIFFYYLPLLANSVSNKYFICYTRYLTLYGIHQQNMIYQC